MPQVRYLARRLARVICLGINRMFSRTTGRWPYQLDGVSCRDQWDTIWKMVVLWENHRKTREMVVLWENDRKTIGKWWFYPLVNFHITDGKISIFNGQIHYFDWAIFNSYVTNYQRVKFLKPSLGYWHLLTIVPALALIRCIILWNCLVKGIKTTVPYHEETHGHKTMYDTHYKYR